MVGKMNKKIAVYPGSFDPITNGHISIITRAMKIVDELTVVVADNYAKNSLFTTQEKIKLIEGLGIEGLRVTFYSGLLIEECKRLQASIIIRGLRAVSDFDYEFQLALGNRRMDREIETVFLMTSYKYSYLSSSLVKEIAFHGGSVEGLVSENVEKALAEKVRK